MPKPSPTQQAVLDRLATTATRTLVQTQSGYWTTKDTLKEDPVGPCRRPDWSCHTNTVKAMVARRWLEPVDRHQVQPYRLTETGIKLAATAAPLEACIRCGSQLLDYVETTGGDHLVVCRCGESWEA
jgi:hypothetical protein